MTGFIVFDLDGTLANCTHRLHHIQQEPKNWDAFYAACALDAPIEPVIRLFRSLRDVRVDIWTGRSAEVERKTRAWLTAHRLFPWYLRMRGARDYRQDDVLKAEWLDSLPSDERPTLVFEDRKRVVDMWRSRGIQCCQVATGEF